MFKKSAQLAVLATAALLSTGALADTATLQVRATVSQVCRIYSAATGSTLLSGNLSMAFGAVDPTAAGPYTASTTMYYRCNVDSIPQLSLNGNNSGSFPGILTSGTDTMAYTITWTPPAASTAGLGAANAQSVTFNGSLTSAAFGNKPAGNYGQDVTITLAP